VLTRPTGVEVPETVQENLDRGAAFLDWLLGPPLQSLVAVLVGVLVLGIVRAFITRAVRSVVEGGTTVRRHTRRLLLRTRVAAPAAESDALAVARRIQRAETMGSVLRSAAALLIGVIVLTVVANINEWELGPVLASAGVAGVALGFGAQTLVKDFLSGLFMLIEDQYGVGDVVNLGEATGTVEAVGLRVTQVRDLNGTLWYVRNGEILRVGNMTQGWSKALVEVMVPPDAEIPRAAELLLEAARQVVAEPETAPHVLAEPEVTAFEALTAESVTLRMTVKVAPAKQWAVQRAVRARVRELFAAEGVALALPRREVMVERDLPRAEQSSAGASRTAADGPAATEA
jgi:moderate conductance mechanosensitive channel